MEINIKPFCYKKLNLQKADTSRAFLFLKAPLRPLKNCSTIFKLSSLFQIDALADWTLCYGQSLILHCVYMYTELQKGNN